MSKPDLDAIDAAIAAIEQSEGVIVLDIAIVTHVSSMDMADNAETRTDFASKGKALTLLGMLTAARDGLAESVRLEL